MREFLAMEDIRSRGAWQAAIAELIATFSFVFLGAGAVVVAVNILGEAGPKGPRDQASFSSPWHTALQ